MMAVYLDDYIAGVFGSYTGKINDASMMNELLGKDYWTAFKKGDVFIIDRGFRDSIPHIEKKTYIPKMPSFSDGSRLPLTTGEVNTSRLVTKMLHIMLKKSMEI